MGAKHFPRINKILLLLLYMALVTSAERIFHAENSDGIIDLRSDSHFGNFGSEHESEYYRLLKVHQNYLIIGAADKVLNLTIMSVGNSVKISNSSIYRWSSLNAVEEECKRKAAAFEDCKNYIRIFAENPKSNQVLLCGTNSFKPLCRLFDSNSFELRREFSGVGLSPLEPQQNSTFYLHGDDLYAATTSDFTGTDALIYRRDVTADSAGIRTERNNLKHLNAPQFAGSVHSDKYVYFFFREKAVEAESVDGYGASGYYSRVARVCKNDEGGPDYYSNEWTSFVKARLNCSLPGSKQFYFDQIISIASITNQDDIIYASYVSEYDFFSHSVICAFTVADIDRLFDASDYLVSDSSSSTFYRKLKDSDNGTGSCIENSRNISRDTMKFIKSTPLMADLVPNIFGRAVGIYQGSDHYNHLAVLPKVHLPEHNHHVDVIYVGTDQGNVIKFVNTNNNHGRNVAAEPLARVSIYKIANHPIRNLAVFDRRLLVVVTDRKVTVMSVEQCHYFATCKACVKARDPHCGWHTRERRCKAMMQSEKYYIQDVLSGNDDECRNTELPEVDSEPRRSLVVKEESPAITFKSFNESLIQPVQICNCSKKDLKRKCKCNSESMLTTGEEQAITATEAKSGSKMSPMYSVLLVVVATQLFIIVGLLVLYWVKCKKRADPSDQIIRAYQTTSKPVVMPSISCPSSTSSGQSDPGYSSGSYGSKSGSEAILESRQFVDAYGAK